MSEEERLDTPEDMEARERMFDQVERSHYEHEGAKLRGAPPVPAVGELVDRLEAFAQSKVNNPNVPAREYLQSLVRELRSVLQNGD